MKILDTFIHAVVLWTFIESRNVGRFKRSLDVEGKGSNLTQRQHQGMLQSDVLQHFTTTPPSASETSGDHSIPSLIKDLPYLPEDIQSLKNDDHVRVSFNRKIAVDKENADVDSSRDRNKTLKTNTNDVIYVNYNKTGKSSSTSSEITISHSSYEHSSTSVAYDEDDTDEETQGSVVSSSTESPKVGYEWRNVEAKKKEKGKKEILDSVTVPTDAIGGSKLEKPFKDSLLNVKLKDKNKDSISEALDDRRSTTSRIRSSVSVSLSDHDNNKLQSNLELLKVNLPNPNNKEAVNQSVNSVINVNGVNNDSLKKPKVKTSVKRIVEDSSNVEVENSATNLDHVIDDTAKNTVPVVSHDTPTTPSTVYSGSTPLEKTIFKQYPPVRRSQLTEPFPTKADILPKATISSSTTVIKPSIAFKQQLANKLKSLEPTPTAPMASIDEIDEIQGKSSGKTSTKFTLRKKPKLEHASLPEMNIPPTATAWTLASLKSLTDTLSSLKPDSLPESQSTNYESSKPRLSTLPPVSRVKSFVPWSTRLLKTSTNPPSSAPVNVENLAPTTESNSNPIKNSNSIPSSESADSLKTLQPSTTEGQSVIRTTKELDRNLSETSRNIIQTASDDMMVKDQSSPTPIKQFSISRNLDSTTEISDSSSSHEIDKNIQGNHTNNENESQVVENVIEAQQLSEENESQSKKEEKNVEKLEESSSSNKSGIGNQIPQDVVVNESANEVKSVKTNESKDHNDVILETKTSTTPEMVENTKIKNVSEQIDTGASDLVGDNHGEDGKSGEESEEEERQNSTTLPPIFEPFETTTPIDLDEDVDGESDREEEDFPLLINKTSQISTNNPIKPNETQISPISKTLDSMDTNGTGTYVTRFDIITKENASQVVTKTPSEGDINWYSVDTKQNNESVEETSEKPIPAEVTTTVSLETTLEPETSTKSIEQETTLLPGNSDTATMMPPTTTVVTQSSAVTETVTIAVERDPNFDIVDDSSSCVRIFVHMSPARLCQEQQQLRENIAEQLTPHIVSWDQVLILKPQECEAENLSNINQDLSVDVCFAGTDESPSPAIRNEFLRRFIPSDSNFPIINVQMIMDSPMGPDGFDNVLAAIILSVIAAICLVLLGILLVIVRKRQGKFNYGQRCTPVSLDDYSLDNISVYNSVRRKGALRASKRSYGNPGFDDPVAPSHPINFAGLANFSSDREALDEEFSQIPMITVKPDELPPGAEAKNRYANVIPLPETRVALRTAEGAEPLDEYINANYIKGTKGQEKLYIACQAPLQSTIEDFWKMVWQQQTKVILMLTALNENGVEKCADYLPQLEITDCHRMFGDFQVTLKKHEVREKYIISSLQLKNLETNLWREVTHLWYVSWPAQGVPEDCSSMIAFLIEARSYMRGAQGPTVVHCSPGTGRTGTVIAIDLCIRDFETLRSVDIPKTVYALRRDRAGSVQTKDQYAFIYKVLNLYATKLTGGALDSF